MDSFGDKMRQAVAGRGLDLDEVADATGLDVEQLQALQRNDFSGLPDDERVREALASFARLVDVSPDDVIADFREERQRRQAQEAAAMEPVVLRDGEAATSAAPPSRGGDEAIPEPIKAQHPAGRFSGAVVVVVALITLVAVGVLWLRSTSTPETGNPAATAPAMSEVATESPDPLEGANPLALPMPDTDDRAPAQAAETTRLPVPLPPPVTPTSSAPATAPAAPVVPPAAPARTEAPAASRGLAIAAHGVGTGVVDHELVGEAGRFATGSEVWFWTRVEGGAAGDLIEHVWLHQGREMLRIPLRIGGPRWRTQSAKTLHPGSAGDWTVEARDAAGSVLARSAFTCTR